MRPRAGDVRIAGNDDEAPYEPPQAQEQLGESRKWSGVRCLCPQAGKAQASLEV